MSIKIEQLLPLLKKGWVAKDGDKIEVLSLVPSFDETVMMITLLDKMEEENKKLKKQLEIAVNVLKKVNSEEPYPWYIAKMLLNPKNVTENVANHEMQHCESQTNLHTTDE